MKAVESSNIQEVGYDAPTQTLHVLFHGGGHYTYSNVSPAKHEAFLKAKSPGKHFALHIKSHPCEKLST